MLSNLFPVSIHQAAIITSVYVSFYAFGRLFSGICAGIDIFSSIDTLFPVISKINQQKVNRLIVFKLRWDDSTG